MDASGIFFSILAVLFLLKLYSAIKKAKDIANR